MILFVGKDSQTKGTNWSAPKTPTQCATMSTRWSQALCMIWWMVPELVIIQRSSLSRPQILAAMVKVPPTTTDTGSPCACWSREKRMACGSMPARVTSGILSISTPRSALTG